VKTLTVNGVRTFAGVPESVRAARAWVADCLPDSSAAADAALMVSELFTNAILYSTSGHPGGLVTMSIAIGRGMARIHVIDQGGHLELSQAARSVAAAVAEAPHLGAGLTIVRDLADEFAAEGPDKCFTLRVAVPVRPSPPDGPGESGAGTRAACSRDYVTAGEVMTTGPGLEPGLVAEPEL
jgi:anti-sigma regulatory factor (Ser/Thr protein kinase)